MKKARIPLNALIFFSRCRFET